MPRRLESSAISPRKQPGQARSRALVEAILDATARVLVRRGLAGANTNAIAELAGVSVGSLYQYFPGKHALVAALHERHARELLAVIEREIASAPARSLAGTVRSLVRAVIEAHLVDPALHRVLETEAAGLDVARSLLLTIALRPRPSGAWVLGRAMKTSLQTKKDPGRPSRPRPHRLTQTAAL